MKILRHDLLVRIFLVIGLVLCIIQAGRQGIAAWYFRRGTPEAIEIAIRWDPSAALYYDTLGNLTHLYADSANSDTIIHLYESATRLSPQNAQYWADLGSAYDWAGRTDDALRAFDRARQLFPNSPYINWKLANFFVRTRKIPEALRALRKVLLGGGVAQRDVFTLAANATRDNAAILDQMLPSNSALFFDFLNFRVATGDMGAASEVWDRIAKSDLQFAVPQAFPYLDGLIRKRDLDSLADAWSSLAARFPGELRPRISAHDAIVNGSFEFEPLNGGMDWRVIPVEGAAVRKDSRVYSDGARSLRIDFKGTHNLDFGGVFQFVRVKPDTRYRFSGDMRVLGITTDSGPRFELFDAYDMGKLFYATENLRGNSEWSGARLEFRTNRDTNLLIVRVARPMSRKFDNRIAGTVWIDRISLQPEQ
jgi:Tfp pilus assembly protein PilF